MGTGAVYVTLSGLKVHPGPITHIETVFFFINLSLFILNSSTLLIQALRAILVLPVRFPVSLWICHSISTTVQTTNQRSSQGCLRSPHSEYHYRTQCITGLLSQNRCCHLPRSLSEPSTTELYRGTFPQKGYTYSFGK